MKKITDVQGQVDLRDLDIKKVGITGYAYRGMLLLGKEIVPAQGTANCFAYLDKSKKGTHMSRMSRNLNQLIDKTISLDNFEPVLQKIYSDLETPQIYVEITANSIRTKESPVSKNVGFEEFKINLDLKIDNGDFYGTCTLAFTGTSLCPASKTNSKHGAHNQRSVVKVKFPFEEINKLGDYLHTAEEQLSAIVYPVIKLDDEAYITEKAYENAKFVEDIVRDVVRGLQKNDLKFTLVSCENLESIHTHNAYAEIVIE